jgi:CheY-like chemotaxis protein
MRQQRPDPLAPPEKVSVLVADDDHMVRVLLLLGLERTGFDVWLATNGREAIDLYQQHQGQIAVVLLDVQMPDLDGVQTLEVLRALRGDVRACFMSSDTGHYDPAELIQRGAAAVIDKPFHLNELVNLLRRVVQDIPAQMNCG